MDENLEEEEILSVISKRLDADLRINIQTNKRRIFEEKSSLHASNPIVSPIISRCSAHIHTHIHRHVRVHRMRCKHGAQRYGKVKFSFNLDVD